MDETQRISAVVFDLDGTLYSLGARQLRMTGMLWRWRDLRVLRHLLGTRSWIRSKSFPDRNAFFRVFYRELGARAGISPGEARDWYENRFLRSFVKLLAQKARVRPGLLELLDRLRENDAKLAVVSDYGYVRERLAALKIPAEAFDKLCSNEEYGALKPSPRALVSLAREWELDPKSIVVVGDRADLDQKSATDAGMGFVGVAERAKSHKDGFVPWSEAAKQLEDRAKLG